MAANDDSNSSNVSFFTQIIVLLPLGEKRIQWVPSWSLRGNLLPNLNCWMFTRTPFIYQIIVACQLYCISCAGLCDHIAARRWRACVMNIQSLTRVVLRFWLSVQMMKQPSNGIGRTNVSLLWVYLIPIILLPECIVWRLIYLSSGACLWVVSLIQKGMCAMSIMAHRCVILPRMMNSCK